MIFVLNKILPVRKTPSRSIHPNDEKRSALTTTATTKIWGTGFPEMSARSAEV